MKLNEDLIVIEPFEAKEKIEELKAQIEEAEDWRVRKNLLTLLDIYLFQTLYESDHKEETNCNIDKEDWEKYSDWTKEQAKKLYNEHPELEKEDKERDAKIEASVKDDASSEVGEQEKVEESLEESKLEEANYMDQVDKMKKLEAGTRGFNAKAASDEKLRLNQQICKSYNLPTALAIVEDEMRARGILGPKQPQSAPQPAIKSNKVIIHLELMDFHGADAKFVKDAKDTSEIINNCASLTDQRDKGLKMLLISLVWALCLQKPSEFIQALRIYLTDFCDYSNGSIKETINECLNNPEIVSRLNQITQEVK